MATASTSTERVIFIEYRDGRPFEVITTNNNGRCRTYYDVEWCKRYQRLYFHESGGGGYTKPIKVDAGVTYWAAPDAPVEAEAGAILRDGSADRDRFEREFAGEWSEGVMEGETEYCSTCDDYLPTADTYAPCDHIWWCDEAGWWSKPGERCPWDCPDCNEWGRETKPPSPRDLLAEGYGIAASRLAMVARKILAERGLTPESLARRMGWCEEGLAAIRDVMQGERPNVGDDCDLLDAADHLELSYADRAELYEAFTGKPL